MSAWTKQLKRQVDKLGADKAPWHVFWDEPDGTRRSMSCGCGKKGRKLADEKVDRINAQLKLGTYEVERHNRVTWKEFAKEYREKILAALAVNSLTLAVTSLDHFARILKLNDKAMAVITTERIDQFRAERRKERGKKPKSTISPATVNRDLRHIKAALGHAVEWKYLEEMPRVKFEREPEKIARYITPEHFAAIYGKCDVATLPVGNPAGKWITADWWRGLIVMAQMTGWRIGELLALEWKDADLDAALAKTRHSSNKGKRDAIVPLHEVVVDHLRLLRGFHANVFPFEHDISRLYVQFAMIQDAAGIKLDCSIDGPHDCTDACHRYGFHDERRAFATLNAPNMTRETLQALMRHASPLTTAKYINFAKQVNPAVQSLVVPDVLKKSDAG